MMILLSLLRSLAFAAGIAYIILKTLMISFNLFELICFFASVLATLLWVQAYFTMSLAV